MNKLNVHELKTNIEQKRKRDRAQTREEKQAMDAFAARVVESLTVGLPVVEDDGRWLLGPSVASEAPPSDADARRAIEIHRQLASDPSPVPESGEAPLHAALRGIVADYAEAVTPSDELITDLEEMSGIALDEADKFGLWADIQLEEALSIRTAMADVVDDITDRAESLITETLVAAHDRLAKEYPDVPGPEALDMNER